MFTVKALSNEIDIRAAADDFRARVSELRALIEHGAGSIDPKHLAILIHLGGAAKLKIDSHQVSPRMARLMSLSETAHGRIKLSALEPDLAAILRRGPNDGFYGFTEAEFHREFRRGVWPGAEDCT